MFSTSTLTVAERLTRIHFHRPPCVTTPTPQSLRKVNELRPHGQSLPQALHRHRRYMPATTRYGEPSHSLSFQHRPPVLKPGEFLNNFNNENYTQPIHAIQLPGPGACLPTPYYHALLGLRRVEDGVRAGEGTITTTVMQMLALLRLQGCDKRKHDRC